jgi:isocitrate lyase
MSEAPTLRPAVPAGPAGPAGPAAEGPLAPSPLLPDGFVVPATRWTRPSERMRELLATEPYLFGPGVYDPFGAQLVMHHGFRAVYFSGYSFAIGHLGTTDMDLYTGTEIAEAARRTVAGLRKFQLTMAVGDPEKGVPPRHLDIPPVIVDMDAGYGNIFNVQRITELYVTAGVAAAHIEDQVLPKRCGHIGGKALVPVNEMLGKLRMMRAVADDLGDPSFVVIARTDGLSAVDAPEPLRGMELAVERGLRYLDSGVPDLLWCEFPTSDREPVETFTTEIRKRFPDARFAFNYSSSFKWYNDPQPLTFDELAAMGVGFLFITLGGQHAAGYGLSTLLEAMADRKELGYIELQRREWAPGRTSRPARTTSSAACPTTTSWAARTMPRDSAPASSRTCRTIASCDGCAAGRAQPSGLPGGQIRYRRSAFRKSICSCSSREKPARAMMTRHASTWRRYELYTTSTGQFVPNMMRSGPNASMQWSTHGVIDSTVQWWSIMPKPLTLQATLGPSARALISDRQRSKYSAFRSSGKPACPRMTCVPGKARAASRPEGMTPGDAFSS